MSIKSIPEPWKHLADELENFQEIARYLNPSPGEIPELSGVDIAGLSIPVREVIGGDHILYVDFNRRYDLDRRIEQAKSEGRDDVVGKLRRLKRRAGIVVVDVSGHRMTDALLGAMLHQAFLLGAYYELDMFGEITTRIFEHINTRFYRTTAVNKYFTMIYGEISESGRFRFLSAGHQPPAVFSREYGHFVQISHDRLVSFPPVGMFPSSHDPDDRVYGENYHNKGLYSINEIDLLAVGDILLLYTDGLSDHAGGHYFPERVEQLLADFGNESSEEICARLREDLFRHGQPKDDISAVVIRKTS